MDDENTIATSEVAPQDDPHFASEIVEDTPPEEPKSTREALEAAFDKAEGKEPATPEPVLTEPTEPAPPPLEIADGPKKVKAPAGWKPETRELFDSLPDSVKAEVARREFEISETLNKTGAERRVAYEFMQAAQPYEQHYRAMGIDSISAARQLFQADHSLRTGSRSQKAETIAQAIKEYGVDLEALNDVLLGQAPKEAPASAYDQELRSRLERMEQFAYQQQHSAAQAQQTQINTSIEQFANDPKNEFFNDVAPLMIGLLQSGSAPDLKSAYEQACYANPNVRNVLTQREQANKAKLAAGSASLPVKGPRNGNQPAPQRFKSTRDALEAAWSQYNDKTRV